MKPIPEQAVYSISNQETFLQFLKNHLDWKIQDDISFDDLTFGWSPEEMGLKSDDLHGSKISQLRPFTNDQPWGIFFIHLAKPQVYVTQLRKLIRSLAPMKRKHKDYPTWNPQHLLFICTPDWKNYTFAHFEGEKPESAKLSIFGWECGSDFIRTLCEFNLPQLRFPEDQDMFELRFSGAWVKQWSAAFDVKSVTKKFYQEYDKIFRDIKRLLAHQFKLSPKLYDKKYAEWTEKERDKEKPLHLFVQNLVNRLMFLKFLEKRRWLNYNPNYLADLYNKAISRNDEFYQKYLLYVFFAGLNRQVQRFKLNNGDVVAKAQYAEEDIGVLPFLNGGLFEKEPRDEEITIPNEAFKELFELFSRYNFTITEDTPLDVEVAVNPEMLGKVFEESVITRKEKGAYYTPRNIVSFMCREALKNHLQGQLSKEDAKVKIEALVESRSAELLDGSDALEIYKALYNIKVLDPAAGSGAFLVGMMMEILEVYKAIGAKLEKDNPYIVKNKLANPHEVYKLKKQIIQNNLYGVDIEEFAINIARLRFWLSLAVDFPIDFNSHDEFIARVHEIEPLPNLIYKVKCGDSLLANYHGVSLEPHKRLAKGEYAIGRKQRIQDAIKAVTDKKRGFFTESDSAKKKTIQTQIESSLKSLVVKEIEVEIDAMRKETAQDNLFGMTKKQREEHETIEKEIARLSDVKNELIAIDGLPANFPVIWDVDFGEVMNPDRPPSSGKGNSEKELGGLADQGFDVVIANPPYVRQEDIKELKEELALHYECYTGTSDLYTYFYERGIKLLKPKGTLSFISSNKFFRAGYGAKLRQYLSENTTLQKIIDFGDLPVFEATTYPCIVIAKKHTTAGKGEATDNAIKARTVTSIEELEHFEETFLALAIEMRQSDLSTDGWRIEDKHVLALLEKIKKAGVPLEEYVEGKIYYGIKTGYNEAFVIDEDTKNRLIKEDKKSLEMIKPVLRGRDVKRYLIDYQNLYLIYVPRGWTNENRKKQDAEKFFKITYFSIYKYLKQFEKHLTKRDDQGDYWWEMRPCRYLDEMNESKIVWGNLGDTAGFTHDQNQRFTTAPACMVPTDDFVLLALLNSHLGDYFFHQIAAVRRGGYLEYKPMYVSQLPIATFTPLQRRTIEEGVEKILKAKKENPSANTTQLEREIDEIVYEIYGLTEEERRIVEGKV